MTYLTLSFMSFAIGAFIGWICCATCGIDRSDQQPTHTWSPNKGGYHPESRDNGQPACPPSIKTVAHKKDSEDG